MDYKNSMPTVTLVLKEPVPPYYTIHGNGHRMRQGLLLALLAHYRLSMTATLLPPRPRARITEER